MDTTTAFSESIDSYLNYTRMPWGRLFYRSAWEQIDCYLTGEGQFILDIGCGFGISSKEYSGKGHRVTAVEPTPGMVAIAAKEASNVRYLGDSFERVAGSLGTFDWIFCHNVLEYTEDPEQFLQLIGGCQHVNGYLSLIAHNPAAKVMKKAIITKDPDSALASLCSNKEYSGLIQTEFTVYPYEQLAGWLKGAGYEIEGHFGIHNLYGYIADNELKQDGDWHNRMMSLELELGKHSPYRDIAIFTHIIAKKSI